MHLTMISMSSSLRSDIWFHVLVEHFLMLFTSILSMTKRYNPLCKPADSGSITFWERKWSSTLIKILYNSCRHKERYIITAIKNGPQACKNSTRILSTRREIPTMLLTASFGPRLSPSPQLLTPMDMRPLGGQIYATITLTLLFLIRPWVSGNKF